MDTTAEVSQEEAAAAADGPEKDINWRLIFSRSVFTFDRKSDDGDPYKKLFPSSIREDARADLHKFRDDLLEGEGEPFFFSSMSYVKLSLRPA